MLSNHFKKIQYESSKGTIFKCNYSTYHTFRSANSLYWQLINTSSSIYTVWPNVKRICSFKKSKNEKKSYQKKSKMPCHSLKFCIINIILVCNNFPGMTNFDFIFFLLAPSTIVTTNMGYCSVCFISHFSVIQCETYVWDIHYRWGNMYMALHAHQKHVHYNVCLLKVLFFITPMVNDSCQFEASSWSKRKQLYQWKTNAVILITSQRSHTSNKLTQQNQ